MLGLIKHIRKIFQLILTVGIAIIIASIYGCTASGEPRVRLGTYATPTLGTRYIDAENLGKHSYESALSENNGIVYTCRGGHIDITHVRIAADNVKHIYNKARKCLLNNDSKFTFKFNVEPSVYTANLQYPSMWKTLPRKDKEEIIDEAALELSQYCTYTMVTWHEVLTWFGFKTVTFWSEEPSAFSWEDIYSNLIGVRLGAQALQDKSHSFNEAMTILLQKELESLQILSSNTARQAAEKMRGEWFAGFIQVDMKERNMDIGLDDGFITPTLVPGICDGTLPKSYPVPALDKFNGYGFVLDLIVEPKEFEKEKIFRLVYPNGGKKTLHLSEHLPIVMDFIKKQAIEKGFNIMPHTEYVFDPTIHHTAGKSLTPSLYHQP